MCALKESNYMMDRYEKIVSILTKITGVAACVVLFATMAVVSLSVLMRIFFNSPIAGLTDIVSLLNALAVAFAISVAERRRKHIRVNFVREYLPPRIGKTIYFFMSLLAMLVIVVISWRFFLYIFSTLQHGSATWIMDLPHWPVVLCLFIGLIIFLITMVYNFLATISNRKSSDIEANEDAINL